MVNQELVNWIKSEEAQGYSEKALTKILTKQNYSQKDIQEAFNSLKEKNNKTPFSISFTLLAGLEFISLVLIAIILSITTTTGTVIGYLLIILSGTGIGYFINYIKQKLNASERLGTILGIFSPTLSLILIIASLKILQKQAEQLRRFAANPQEGVAGGMLHIFNVNIDPLFSAILFYLFCNIFIIISIIKTKEYKTFLWYLLAPTLLLVIWFIIDLLISSVIGSTLM